MKNAISSLQNGQSFISGTAIYLRCPSRVKMNLGLAGIRRGELNSDRLIFHKSEKHAFQQLGEIRIIPNLSTKMEV